MYHFISLSRVRLCNLMDCSQPGSSVHTSVQFSRSVVSASLQPHGLQHTRSLCPSPSPEVFPSSCPLHWWYQTSHLLTPSSPAFNLSPHQGLFQCVCITWPKYWSFSFSISPSNEYSELISLKIDWFDLLAVQGTLRSLLQHHSSKASILWHSAFMVQLSQLCMTTGKTIALTVWTLVRRLMSLFFNTLSRFVIAFLPRSNHLISGLRPPSTVILEPRKRKSVTASTFSASICYVVMGLDVMIFF